MQPMHATATTHSVGTGNLDGVCHLFIHDGSKIYPYYEYGNVMAKIFYEIKINYILLSK